MFFKNRNAKKLAALVENDEDFQFVMQEIKSLVRATPNNSVLSVRCAVSGCTNEKLAQVGLPILEYLYMRRKTGEKTFKWCCEQHSSHIEKTVRDNTDQIIFNDHVTRMKAFIETMHL